MSEYNVIAKLYDPLLNPVLGPIRKQVYRTLVEQGVQEGDPVSDLCCGTGHQLRYLQSQGFSRLQGVDLSAAMLAVARSKSPESVQLLQGDASRTEIHRNSQKAVLISLALHEKPPETAAAILKEAGEILQAQGWLVVVDYKMEAGNSFSRTLIRLAERSAGKEHHRCFQEYVHQGELPALLQLASLQILELVKEAPTILPGIHLWVFQKPKV